MINTARAKLFWSLEFWAGIWSEFCPEKILCFYSWNLIFANSPYPKEVTIAIKAKVSTTAIVMQPAINLQNTSAPTQTLFTHFYNWGEGHLGSHVFHLWPQKSAVPYCFCSMSPFLVICVHTHEQWEWAIWGVGIGSHSAMSWSGLPATDKNPMTAALINLPALPMGTSIIWPCC